MPDADDEVSITEPPGQIAVVPPGVMVGVAGVTFTVTTRSAVVTPQGPVAVAVMVAVPLKPPSQSITPVEGLMVPATIGNTE